MEHNEACSVEFICLSFDGYDGSHERCRTILVEDFDKVIESSFGSKVSSPPCLVFLNKIKFPESNIWLDFAVDIFSKWGFCDTLNLFMFVVNWSCPTDPEAFRQHVHGVQLFESKYSPIEIFLFFFASAAPIVASWSDKEELMEKDSKSPLKPIWRLVSAPLKSLPSKASIATVIPELKVTSTSSAGGVTQLFASIDQCSTASQIAHPISFSAIFSFLNVAEASG
mmetsp:Transcript_45482/g.88848  ORF Transcript_45482/g.88848 Transcript_45482/m.88848 type:complete len:225 (+) Transcript_45482:2606-3280(+)